MQQMIDAVRINVAGEFSKFPSGRDDIDGPNNGTRFRKELLVPRFKAAVAQCAELTVELDEVLSFGSSFLEEAFGGMIRREGISKSDLMRVLKILPGREGNRRYSDAIYRYIQEARHEEN
jgi:hypothetical protein